MINFLMSLFLIDKKYKVSNGYLNEIYENMKYHGEFITLGSIKKVINNINEIIELLLKLKCFYLLF